MSNKNFRYAEWDQFVEGIRRVDQMRPEGVQVMHEMVQRMVNKGHDYSGADQDTLHNLKASEDLGIPAWKGVMVRINDKWRRCVNFCRQSVLAVKDESFEDTLIDMAVYCVWCVVLWRERNRDIQQASKPVPDADSSKYWLQLGS